MPEEKTEARAEAKTAPKGNLPSGGEQSRQESIVKSGISLVLDTYDDIFSDFDPRPYSQRALSDDFLLEARKASRDKVTGMIELIFMVPADKRQPHTESIIKRRLRDHFRKHHERLHDEAKDIIKRGVYFVFAGVIIMLVTTFVLFKYHEESFLKSFLIILLEPAGWFLFWEGLNQAIFESRKKSIELDFYHKMSKVDITFNSY